MTNERPAPISVVNHEETVIVTEEMYANEIIDSII